MASVSNYEFNKYQEQRSQEPVAMYWKPLHGVFTPGGDPAYECPVCGKGSHCYGVENPKAYDVCPNCGTELKYK